MFVEYFMGFVPKSAIRIAGWMLLMPQLSCHKTTCPPPDFPERGRYEPVKAEYEVGQTITYSCDDDIVLKYGDANATCRSSGKWSEKTLFCEIPAKLESQKESALEILKIPTSVIDGDSSTCIQTGNDTEKFMAFPLDHEAIVYFAILCFGEGKATVTVTIVEYLEYAFKVDSGSPEVKCLHVSFQKYVVTKFIILNVLTNSSSIAMCEVYFYTADNNWCALPPNNSVPNGQLEVSRSKAVLHCKEGFKEKDGREVYATCENSTWSYISLQCAEDIPQKGHNTLAIVVGTLIATIILILLGWTIFSVRKKKMRKVCVICKPGNRNGHTSSQFSCDPSTSDVCTVENSSV
ncbi:unnamed protein product [Larinioides sclopetarius]|uniref:Sushi domain-containing protein n=1 Tax=Larinioides sclopetarius TaxID=280406 RepID=A0AAV2B1U3_9ARAC